MRSVIGRLHRILGLGSAAFLLVAGATGALLAWNDPLDAALNPSLLRAAPLATPLDPLALRERVRAAYPGHRVHHVPLRPPQGQAAVFYAQAGQAAGGAAPQLLQVMVNPFTGQLLGDREPGAWGADRRQLMPFVLRLHHSLALGTAGTLALGIVALAWMVDCVLGAWLTLPARAVSRPGAAPSRPWLARWRPAWTLRRHASGHRRHVDLHRAGGLWPWALLFVFAWSSVALNLTPLHEAVTRPLLGHQARLKSFAPLDSPRAEPGLPWARALATGREWMALQAQAHGFRIEREELLHYDARRGLFSYAVRSSLDLRARTGRTVVVFDGDTGALRAAWRPTGAAGGDTLATWLSALHIADIAVLGWPYRVLVSLAGAAVVMLSVTGVLVWLRKRRARHAARHPPRR